MSKENKKETKDEVTFTTRLIAYCIDFAIIIILTMIIIIPVTLIEIFLRIDPENPFIIHIALIIVSFVYFVGLESYFSTTAGRKMCDIGTTTEKGGEELNFNNFSNVS